MSIHDSDKLAPHAVSTVFIGYSVTQKGYKLFDPLTHKVFVSRHVIFTEFLFPFATLTSSFNSLLYTPPGPTYSGDVDISSTPLADYHTLDVDVDIDVAPTPSPQSSTSDSVLDNSTLHCDHNASSSPIQHISQSNPHPSVPQRLSLRHKVRLFG
ncbi:hypothetical protein POM88_013245 [Heracleum sosnowskyi]|uniref:Retroviral polymerase SH3-like domain-containing protein n=1 Tax=Heracleum sosnowskyi TaxID=360622 RepID=A0AAD8N2I4_9APIA|nr:hypothetical protein POM88_013245 [Heracleum sosnowskyi]